MESSAEVARFWQSKEQELGEPVLMKSISHTYHAAAPDSFGILYASAGLLAYEYRRGGRRSFLDVLLTRRREEDPTETIRVPRAEILAVGLTPTSLARRWLRGDLPPAQVAKRLSRDTGRSLLGWLGGRCLCVCTSSDILVFDTPENRQWLALLRA